MNHTGDQQAGDGHHERDHDCKIEELSHFITSWLQAAPHRSCCHAWLTQRRSYETLCVAYHKMPIETESRSAVATKARATGTDPRRGRSDVRISEATLQLLHGGGPQAVTVEAVASLSGVAKTTIYRRFANRREMLQAALAGLSEAPEPAPDVPTREKIRWALVTMRRALEDILGLSSVGAILAGQDPEFSESVRAVLNPYIEELVALMESAVAAGNVRSEIDADTVLSLILGAHLGEHLRFGRIREEWLDQTLEVLWSGIGMRDSQPTKVRRRK